MSAERMIHDLVQGSDEWHQFRLEHDGASEAAAALGLSKKTMRTELLRMKHTGIAKEFSDWVQENVLDRGHEAEAAARPFVEQTIGQDLYPATYSYGRLSASCDGLTMDGEIAFEHKQYNRELFAAVKRAELPDEYMPQCQQVMHVTGAKLLIFVCSDGTPENLASMEVRPDPEWVKRIEAGWAQFHEDLANYQHVEAAPIVTAAPINELPALMVEITGSVTASNLEQWKEIVTARIADINTDLQTDRDFADADAMVKFLDDGEKRIDLVKSQAQANAADIDRVFRALDEIKASMRSKRLELDKLVTRRKESIKIEIMQAGKDALASHIAGLNKRLAKVQLPPIAADFAAAIKGKRNLESMRDAVLSLVAAKKIEANEIADRITLNLQALHDGARPDGADYTFLFSDYASLILKAPDDLALVIKSRISEHQIAEEKRHAEERERIRIEEEAKATAKVKAEQEEAERQRRAAEEAAAKIERDRLTEANSTRHKEPAPQPDAQVLQPAMASPCPATAVVAVHDNGRHIRLGEINALLGFTVTAEFLAGLGFVATQDKNARLYRECDMPAICQAIIEHVAGVPARMQAGKLREAA